MNNFNEKIAIPVMTLNVYKRRRVFLIFRNNFMILRAFIRHIISQINDERQYSFRQLGHKQNHKAGIADEKVSFIWSVADLLRGPYRPNQYKDVMLPLTVLRRLDCVLEPTKDEVIKKYKSLENSKITNPEKFLNRVAGQTFHNTSPFTFEKLKGDPDNIAANLTQYIKSFSNHAREIIEHFGFEENIDKLEKADRLYQVVAKFCEIDLHPDKVSNIEMGYIFEELIRRFNEASNEEAGDHFTPREVIRLMVNLIFAPDNDTLTTRGIVKTLYDPAAGTGGCCLFPRNTFVN